jgi:uncharacterized membrane protein HdeD (DUF308 family)
MFVAPGTLPDFTHKFTREAAERVASNWWRVLLNGILLVVAGVLIFSIDRRVRSLATFIGALFIAEGVAMSLFLTARSSGPHDGWSLSAVIGPQSGHQSGHQTGPLR